jgi:hypothetical protein
LLVRVPEHAPERVSWSSKNSTCPFGAFGKPYAYYEKDIRTYRTVGDCNERSADGLQRGDADPASTRRHERSCGSCNAEHQQVSHFPQLNLGDIGLTPGKGFARPFHALTWICRAGNYTAPMKRSFCLSLAASLVLIGCGESSDKPPQTTNGAASGSSPLSAPADYVGALGKAQQTAVKTVDTTSLNQAIQMFNVENGRNPKDLNELVEKKLIPKLPDAPRGMKLDYDAAAGKVKVVKE